ncbi:MAG: hypothetical protein ABH873_00510 [Candidatus Firestonebacteria bacterium]
MMGVSVYNFGLILILNEQIALLPIVKLFFKDLGLVGGTAIALHIDFSGNESICFGPRSQMERLC